MPVFNPGIKPATTKPPTTQPGDVPAWMQGNNAGDYVSPNVGQGPLAQQATQTYYGKKSRKRGRGNQILIESPNAPKPVAEPINSPTGSFIAPQPQTQVPAWLGGFNNNPYGVQAPAPQVQNPASSFNPYTSPQQAAAGMAQPTTQPNPYRIQNPDGSWSYLQADGTYLSSNGTVAGGVGSTSLRNSYVNMPPLLQLKPPTSQSGYSPFSSSYGWKGGGGRGGGDGYTYSPQVPRWMMGLNSWNFGE